MRESTVINAWIDEGRDEGIDEGRDEGRIQQAKGMLRTLLTKRFTVIPTNVLQRIDAVKDADVLDRAFVQAFDVARPEDLPI